MSDYTIGIDPDGHLAVGDGAPGLLGTFLRCDVNVDIACCDLVLALIAEIRSGSRNSYGGAFDVTYLTLTATGATLRIAGALTRNADVPVTLDALEDGLRRTRAVLANLRQPE